LRAPPFLLGGLCEKPPVVEFTVVKQNMRVGIGRDRELPLPDERRDLGPRAALPV